MMKPYSEFDVVGEDMPKDDYILDLKRHNDKANKIRNKVSWLSGRGLNLAAPYLPPSKSQLNEMFSGEVQVAVAQIEEHGIKMPTIYITGRSHSMMERARLGYTLHFDDLGVIDRRSTISVSNSQHYRPLDLSESFGGLDGEILIQDGRTEQDIWFDTVRDFSRGLPWSKQTRFPLTGSDIVFLDQLIADVYPT